MPTRNPTPDEIRAAREAAQITQADAAALIYYSGARWQEWEYGKHRMHPALWDLFRHRAGIERIPFHPRRAIST